GHVWKPKAFDTFACSQDLVNWTKWDGPHLIEPSAEGFDSTFAHKPWMIKHDGVVYHFYCSVHKSERTIALATSKDFSGKGARGSERSSPMHRGSHSRARKVRCRYSASRSSSRVSLR